MNWIKKNPAQFALAIIAVFLLLIAYTVFSSVGEFSSKVVAKPLPPSKRNDLPKPDIAKIDESLGLLNRPAMWESPRDAQGLPTVGSLFVSRQYVLDKGVLTRPGKGYFNMPVPNQWLMDYGLDFGNTSILDEDPDKDNFSTRLEWNGMDALSHLSNQVEGQAVQGPNGQALPADFTDPTDAKSHPPYHTRLQVASVVSIPFRLKFMSADVDRSGVTAAVNTVDVGGRTSFIKVGEMIPNTTYKVESYEPKVVKDADGIEKDVSVLTVMNTKSGLKVPLPKGELINSPESFTILHYQWVATGAQPTPDMKLEKDKTFSLPPEADKQYKVVEIKPLSQNAQGQVTSAEVTILLPTGQNLVLKFPVPK